MYLINKSLFGRYLCSMETGSQNCYAAALYRKPIHCYLLSLINNHLSLVGEIFKLSSFGLKYCRLVRFVSIYGLFCSSSSSLLCMNARFRAWRFGCTKWDVVYGSVKNPPFYRLIIIEPTMLSCGFEPINSLNYWQMETSYCS